MKSKILISPDAAFAASKGSHYDSIRAKLFGTPRQDKGLKVKSLPDNDNAAADPRPMKLLRRHPKKSAPSKTAASTYPPDDEASVTEGARKRQPVEYMGYLITNEQQPDGNWVAFFVRMGNVADCAQCSAPYRASHLAFSDAKRQIDAASSGLVSKRKYERVPVALEGATFATGIMQKCQVLDLSQGGARLHFDKPIALKENLHLYIKGFGRFRAQVVRSGDDGVAVRFVVNNEAVSGLLRGLSNYVKGLDISQTKERKEVRVVTSIAAVCRIADGTAIPCEIVNASTRSMSLQIFERPRVGSLVTLGGTKVRVMRHHSKGIAVQCLPPPSPKSGRFGLKED